jgi:threonine/homoserine/homoserine lactone efflux protein
MDASSPSTMNELAGLLGFAFVGSVSPGPNNAVLWASGIRFGFGRTLPHVLGTAIGIGALVLGVAAGLGVVLEAVPAAAVALKIAGSGYLLLVAYRVLQAGGVGPADVARPFGLWQAVAFQCVNPKAWIFAVAAVGTFLPAEIHRAVATLSVTGVLMGVVVASSSLWAAGGAVIGRLVDDERSLRVIGVVLAGLLVISVVLIWI